MRYLIRNHFNNHAYHFLDFTLKNECVNVSEIFSLLSGKENISKNRFHEEYYFQLLRIFHKNIY